MRKLLSRFVAWSIYVACGVALGLSFTFPAGTLSALVLIAAFLSVFLFSTFLGACLYSMGMAKNAEKIGLADEFKKIKDVK